MSINDTRCRHAIAVMVSVMISCYVDCRYGECHDPECHNAECRDPQGSPLGKALPLLDKGVNDWQW